jgi:hypothetical protein
MKKNKEKKNNQRAKLEKIDSDLAFFQNEIAKDAIKDENGLSTISVDLKEVPLYQEGSSQVFLNQAIFDFVENAYSFLDKNDDFDINFKFAEGVGEEEQAKFKKLFAIHYARKYKDASESFRKRSVIAALFLFIGFILLSIHLYYVSFNSSSVYGEMIDILSWVLVWEAGEFIFLGSFESRAELRMFKNLYLADLN